MKSKILRSLINVFFSGLMLFLTHWPKYFSQCQFLNILSYCSTLYVTYHVSCPEQQVIFIHMFSLAISD